MLCHFRSAQQGTAACMLGALVIVTTPIYAAQTPTPIASPDAPTVLEIEVTGEANGRASFFTVTVTTSVTATGRAGVEEEARKITDALTQAAKAGGVTSVRRQKEYMGVPNGNGINAGDIPAGQIGKLQFELFASTNTTSDAERVAKAWKQLLPDKDIVVMAYPNDSRSFYDETLKNAVSRLTNRLRVLSETAKPGQFSLQKLEIGDFTDNPSSYLVGLNFPTNQALDSVTFQLTIKASYTVFFPPPVASKPTVSAPKRAFTASPSKKVPAAKQVAKP